MFRSVLPAVVVAFVAMGTALAADKPVDAQLTSAMDVLEAMNARQNFLVMIDSMGSTVIAQARIAHPNATEKTLAAFLSAFKEEMGASSESLLQMQAAVYAEHFSQDDLKALAAFYRSDVGKRFIAAQPAIIKEVSPLAMKWGQEAGQRAVDRAIEKLKKEGMTL